jgi:hypothetical protein
MAQDTENDVRSQMLQLLLGKVEGDTYPSSTMLDMIEGLLTPEDVQTYARVLMSKVANENYPSISMLQRLLALS